MTNLKVSAHDVTPLYPDFYREPQKYSTQEQNHFLQTSRVLFEVKDRPEGWVQAFTLVPRPGSTVWPDEGIVYLSFQAALDFLRRSHSPFRVLGRPVFAKNLFNDGTSILKWELDLNFKNNPESASVKSVT